MRDEKLLSQRDYSLGQKEAAQMVLVEIVNLLSEYEGDFLIVGGWVPDLLFPNQNHVGSIDVDLLVNHLALEEASYDTIEKTLLKNGYNKHSEKYFTFFKKIIIDDVEFVVDLDIMAGMYGGTAEKHRSQHVQGLRALKATGGNLAFEVDPTQVELNAKRPDGAWDRAVVNVVSIVPYLIMKAAALGRGKAKDAYDIYFCIKNFAGGVDSLAQEFHPFRQHGLVRNMINKLEGKFASPEHAGPIDIISFLELYDDEDIEMTKRDSFEQIKRLIELLEK